MERSLPYIMETTIKQIEDMSLNAWAISQDGIIRRLDPEIFLFLYTQNQQRGTVRQFHPHLA